MEELENLEQYGTNPSTPIVTSAKENLYIREGRLDGAIEKLRRPAYQIGGKRWRD